MSTLRAGWGVTMPTRSCGRPRHCRSSPNKEGEVSGSAASFAKWPLGVRTLGGPSFLSGSPEQEGRAGRQRSVVDAAVVAVFIVAAQAVGLRKRRRPRGRKRRRYERSRFGKIRHVMDCPMAGSDHARPEWIGRAGKRKNDYKCT